MSERSSDGKPKQARREVPWRLIAGVVSLVLIVIFLAENTNRVIIRFVGPQVRAPLVVALLISAVLGALATLMFQHHRRR